VVQDIQEHKVRQEILAPQVLKEGQVQLDLQGRLDLQDLKVVQAVQDTQVLKVLQEIQETQELKVIREQLDLKGYQAQRELKVLKEP
jgi:hypothetical protein